MPTGINGLSRAGPNVLIFVKIIVLFFGLKNFGLGLLKNYEVKKLYALESLPHCNEMPWLYCRNVSGYMQNGNVTC